MESTGVICSKCDEELHSLYRHDFHYCKCGNTFIDGGFDYVRSGGWPKLEEDGNLVLVKKDIDMSKRTR